MTATRADPGAERGGPATVIVAQRVKTGRVEDFRRWQDDLNRTVAGFAGFLGTEVATPSAEDQESTVIYRFDCKPHLEAWLDSSERKELLGRGADLFDGPASQQVVVGESDEDLVTVVVTHPVDPERETEFVAWQERVFDAMGTFAGFRGSQLFRPVSGVQDEWTSMFRFDSHQHLDDWLGSSVRRKLLESGEHFQTFELRRLSNPFGSWFDFGGGGAEEPAAWKTALSVLVGLYPTVVLLTLAISEIWPDGELWETLLLGNVLSVSLLTWVVMPIVTRALHFWLAPEPGRAGPRLDALGAAVSVVFLTLAALVFWLVTTQIWTIP